MTKQERLSQFLAPGPFAEKLAADRFFWELRDDPKNEFFAVRFVNRILREACDYRGPLQSAIGYACGPMRNAAVADAQIEQTIRFRSEFWRFFFRSAADAAAFKSALLALWTPAIAADFEFSDLRQYQPDTGDDNPGFGPNHDI